MSNRKEDYLSLSAMLRAREPRLLSKDRANRMIDAPSFSESAKLLTDCGYPDMSQMNAAEIEQVLSQHRSDVLDELERFSPNKRLVDAFRLKYDYHNCKTLIKSEAMGLDPMRVLSTSGRVKPAELLEKYNNERYIELPELMGKALEEAKSTLARTGNPQQADFLLDKAYFNELKTIDAELGSPFFTGYVQLLADTANLKCAVRTMRMGKDASFMRLALVDGGSIDSERIANISGKDGLTAIFANSRLTRASQLGADAASGGALTGFELACDNAMNAYMSDAKLVAYGEEPVIAYVAAVENEITAVRMILTGALAGIKPETLRERLRDMYA